MLQLKRSLTAVLAAMMMLLAACQPAQDIPEVTQIPYTALYNGASTQRHERVQPGQLVRASYGYLFNDQQGYNGFFYICGPVGATQELQWTDGRWSLGESSICNGVITSADEPCGYLYQVSAGGKTTLEGTLRKNTPGGDACTLEIYQNTMKIFPQSENAFTVEAEDTEGRYFSLEAELKAGDTLYFAVTGRDAYCNPAILPMNSVHSLYTANTKSGYYGDIHVYYHENQVHLYHLWNYGVGAAVWEWDRQVTTDMFRYTDASMDLSFVQNHYMSPAPDLIDYPDYTGGRDCTRFYDPDIDRYRYLALSYRNTGAGNTSCALTLRTSRDSIGMDWGDPCVVLRDFPTTAHGEPECSQLIKIGNRWYLFTSVSGQTVHGVGTVQYFVGEEGRTIDEIDWLHAEPHYLDGEDLCVPQVEGIADRYYLFGWMPRVYNAGYWGGYKNLPREIYQREDGTLGSRLDPLATALLNKGRYLDVDAGTAAVTAGLAHITREKISLIGRNNQVELCQQVGSTFLQFDLDMKDSDQAGYTISCEGKVFRILLSREGQTLYLQVDCPADRTHPISSRVEIEPEEDGIYEMKCVIEGGIIEAFVNDTFALSARTAMYGKNYTPGFFSSGQAKFSEIRICRLAQLHDIYD